jgi:hypothetical protein
MEGTLIRFNNDTRPLFRKKDKKAKTEILFNFGILFMSKQQIYGTQKKSQLEKENFCGKKCSVNDLTF